ARAAVHDLLELRLGIEIEPDRNSESITQRIREKTGAGSRTDERELREINLDRARGGALSDDEVELTVLHRGIKDLFHCRVEPVDLVDEKHVALFQIGEESCEIARLRDHRARRGAKIYAELPRHDLRQSRLAEPGRPDEQHVIERFMAGARGLDGDGEGRARPVLAGEYRSRRGAH